MLTLTRKPGESIIITLEDGREIELLVTEIRRNQVRLKAYAPKTVQVNRLEVLKGRASEPEEAAS